ncbi:hypothetical protein LJR296_006665 [Cupriavidus necator]|uniref:DUF6880 family protein n=1 Tax=Cupriavidus necator TaxID=106590 RepID=UPI003ECD1AC7
MSIDDEIDVKAVATIKPERQGTLLAELAMTHPPLRRRLRFELAAPRGESMVAAVREWIGELAAQTSFLDAEQLRELAAELDAIRVAIASSIAGAAPDRAPDLMWEFFALAGTVYERTTEEGWEVSSIFDEACSDLVKVGVHAGVDPALFATKVVAALISDQYGEYRALIGAIASAEPWAPAYPAQLTALLKRCLDKHPATRDGSNGTTDRRLQHALRELGI